MAVTRRPLAIAAHIAAASAEVVVAHSAGSGRVAVAASGTVEAVVEDDHSIARSRRAAACLGALATAARGGIAVGGTRDADGGREGPDGIQALLAAPRSSLCC